MGCMMQRDCQQDTCPVGIATQNCRAARPLRRQARVRGELHDVRGRGAARDHGRAGLPHRRRDGGPPRVPAPGGGARQLEGQRRWTCPTCWRQATCEFGRAIPGADGRHFLPSMAADCQLDKYARRHAVHPATRASAREHLRAHPLPRRHRQREPLRGHHAGQPGDASASRGPARGLHHRGLRRLRRPELRRVLAPRRDAQYHRRRQRLLRQGPFRRHR